MKRSPYRIAEELHDILCTYLETAYRISHPVIFDDRSCLLRRRGVINQTPFIETTPRFASGVWLRDLDLPWIPQSLADFAALGLPVGRYPLYLHQEQALRSAWSSEGEPRHLIVASGTGSGKTEIFYLTILADILREAFAWEAPTAVASDMGQWSRNLWQHRRRHETRPAAMRAIILYPMNALVNDQLRRLRKMLTTDEALQWQREHLAGNLIYFGRYTGQTQLPGTPDNNVKRRLWGEYINMVRAEWDGLGDDFRKLGNWPRPDGPEMIGRWNIQSSPPDILLTNYSMLEYMLVRPIEAPIFAATRDWLVQSPDNRLTLVLDEAHTYSGARGTEVAYLIRRLYQRLGVGSEQIRCIATSASLGNSEEELARVRRFAASLFSHPEERFTIVQAEVQRSDAAPPPPTAAELASFARFQRRLESVTTTEEEADAATGLLTELSLPVHGSNHIQQLFSALEHYPRLNALRDLTARNATELSVAARRLWQDVGDQQEMELATAGALAAGALARQDGESISDVPPILPSRIHLMFRGLPGLWACLDPNCSAANRDDNRPCGKLYAEPRIWCDCGSRVVELFSCRVCGLLIGGGIAESNGNSGRVWPYEQDLEGGTGQYDRYTIFALEDPAAETAADHEWAEVRRSVRTTAVAAHSRDNIRLVWEPPHGEDTKKAMIKTPCPRCGARPSGSGRSAIEPLRTTGAQAFSALIEHAFRLQPAKAKGQRDAQPDVAVERPWWLNDQEIVPASQPPEENPNKGRKALVFSDSRQNAARLAGDLTYLHYRDLFRQLLLVVLNKNTDGQAIPISTLSSHVLDLAIELGIDPTFGELNNFWLVWDSDRSGTKETARNYLETYMRREIADRQVGVEALGLAQWTVPLFERPDVPPLDSFDSPQTVALLYATLRILAGENVILPRSLDPEDWPPELVETYYRKVITLPSSPQSGSFVWEASRNNRLTRYLKAVLETERISQSMLPAILDGLWRTYLAPTKTVHPTVGNRSGFGVPISVFALAPMPEYLYVCRACGYVSAQTVSNVCLRCHQHCDYLPRAEAGLRQNKYYRQLSDYALTHDMPDPFVLRAREHTAQISAGEAAKRERYFQDQFFPKGTASEENLLQHGVDVLSVTTTMEMGIDIGDLTVVGLHNTPPTVANYQQRGGRAGRRSDGVAEVITFARQRSHDQYYYDRVAEIVTGPVRIPTVHLDNPVIVRRHINALVLQRFFAGLRYGSAETTLFEAFGTVGALLDSDSLRLRQLRDFVESHPERASLYEALRQILAGNEISIHRANEWINDLPARLQELAEQAFPDNLLLNLLIEKGELPRYAFPVDVVALWTERPTRWNQGDEVQRGLDIALSEYAPGSEVIIDGWVHKSDGLYAPFEQNPSYSRSGWYYECRECHHVRFVSSEESPDMPSWATCEMCREPVAQANSKYRVMPAIQPLGFRTDWRRSQKRYRGGGRERAGYASSAQLSAGESADHGELRCQGRLYVHQRTGDLYMINRGPADQLEPGFYICPRCGKQLNQPNERHYDPVLNRNCTSGRQVERTVLLHHFNTDIALLGVMFPASLDARPTTPGGRAAWLSFGTALRQGAAAFLQVDPEELAMGVRPWREPGTGRLLAEVFLYDTLPNGAGYAIEVAEAIEAILERALNVVDHCPTKCETACYHCLLEYGNQLIHPLLDRHLAADIIRYTLRGVQPVLSETAARSAIGHLESFARDKEFGIQALNGYGVTGIVRDPDYGRSVAVLPLHTLEETNSELMAAVRRAGAHPVLVSHFDLLRRPFRVWEQVIPILEGRSDSERIEA